MRRSVLFDQTKDPVYIAKRKELSGAFFKSKLLGMTKIIKEVTLKEIKLLQESGLKEIDIAKMTNDLQSRIIINVAIGTGYSKAKVEWEEDNGALT
jgi:cytochrome P450